MGMHLKLHILKKYLVSFKGIHTTALGSIQCRVDNEKIYIIKGFLLP